MRVFAVTPCVVFLAAAVAAAQEANPPPSPQEPPKPQTEPAPTVPEAAPATPFFGLDRLEVTPRLSLIAFSDDFEADPELGFGVAARAPLPWLSRDVFGLGPDALGAFLDVTVTSIDRDVDLLSDPDGTLFFVSGGADITLIRDDTWLVRGAAGVQYGNFGGVTDLEDGVAFLLGATAGVRFADGFWVTISPQVAFGEGDEVAFLHLGLQIVF